MEIIIDDMDLYGPCPTCERVGQLYDVCMGDGPMESLIEEPICYECAEEALEMMWAEIREEERLNRIIEEEKICKSM